MTWVNTQLAEYVKEYLLIAESGAGAAVAAADAGAGGGGGERGGRKEGLPDESDMASIEAKARVLSRLMVLSVAEVPGAAWLALGQRLTQLCSHAYLPWGAQERAVALVQHLLRFAGRTSTATSQAAALLCGVAGEEVVSFMTTQVLRTLRSSDTSTSAPATLSRVNLMLNGLEAIALLAAAAPGKGDEDGRWFGIGQLRMALRSASESLGDCAISIIQRAAAGVSGREEEGRGGEGGEGEGRGGEGKGGEKGDGGLGLVVALRVVRGVAGPLLVHVRHLGPLLPGCRVPAVARSVCMVEVGARPASIPTREWRLVSTSFASERLLALDALLDASTLAMPSALGDSGSGHDVRGGGAGRGDAWVLPLGDGDAATPNLWQSVGGVGGGGAGAGESGAKEVARTMVKAVLRMVDDAVQDGYALELLQCLARLVPDAVLLDARAAFPSVGKGALRDENLDEDLLLQVLQGAWGVAQQFLQEGRVKGHYTGGDWPQLSRSMMVAFLRAAFHPRLWAVRAAHSGALKARWDTCWRDSRDSARFIKLFATYSCVMWRRFPESLLFYAAAVAELAMYGLPEVSDSVADMPLEAHRLSAGAHAGGIWEGGGGSRAQHGALSAEEAHEDLETDHLDLLLEGRETFVLILTSLVCLVAPHWL
jgi:hypothetical protein